MYALLAIGIALSPTRLDENTMIGLKDRYGDQYTRMQRGCVEIQLYNLRKRPHAFFSFLERKGLLHSKSCSCMRALNSSLPHLHRMRTPRFWVNTFNRLQWILPNDI